jgi:hypothetical protein
VELTANRFEQKLQYCERHLARFVELGSEDIKDVSVLELGTGWYPVIPVALYLNGVSQVYTFDITSHLRPLRIQDTLRMFSEYARRGTLKAFLPRFQPDRLAKLEKAVGSAKPGDGLPLLETLGIHALVRDAQQTGLAPASVSLFISNAVIEYIPRPVLANMLVEFKRVSRPGAVMSHFINLSDEYAQFDRSLSEFNFLKYPDWQWKYLDSPFTRKSRLRISDYRELFAQAGCPIVQEEDIKGEVRELERIRLAPEFARYSKEDLLVLRTWVAARFSPAPSAG